MPKGIHEFVANDLEPLAPAMAWTKLAWYWGFRAIGAGADYREYLQSPEAKIDTAFLRDNKDINDTFGFEQEETKGQRFEQYADFYEYCYAQGMRTSINPPYDRPPSIEQLITAQRNTEWKPHRDEEHVDDFLSASDFYKMIEQETADQHKKRAEKRNERTKDALEFVRSELVGRAEITDDQLTEQGFFERLPVFHSVSPKIMDEHMPEEKQEEMLGDVHKNLLTEEIEKSGLRGRYFEAVAHLRGVMRWDPSVKSILYSTFMSFEALMKFELDCGPVVKDSFDE